MSYPKLKHCDCGYVPEMIKEMDGQESHCIFVVCPGCKMETTEYRTIKDAIRAWNTGHRKILKVTPTCSVTPKHSFPNSLALKSKSMNEFMEKLNEWKKEHDNERVKNHG